MAPPWRIVRSVVIGLLVVIIVATVVSATVGVRWTSSSGGGGIRFSEQHEIKPTPGVPSFSWASRLLFYFSHGGGAAAARRCRFRVAGDCGQIAQEGASGPGWLIARLIHCRTHQVA